MYMYTLRVQSDHLEEDKFNKINAWHLHVHVHVRKCLLISYFVKKPLNLISIVSKGQSLHVGFLQMSTYIHVHVHVDSTCTCTCITILDPSILSLIEFLNFYMYMYMYMYTFKCTMNMNITTSFSCIMLFTYA